MERKNYNNALLLYSICDTQQDNTGSGLKNIIAYFDYVNHAIMNYEEFNNGINYLLKNGLVKEINKRILWLINYYEKYLKNYI